MTKHLFISEVATLINHNPRESVQNLERVIEGMLDNYERDKVESDKSRLLSVDRRSMIVSTHSRFKNNLGDAPLWEFVSDICCVSPQSAAAICRECGWNENQHTKEPLA